MKIKIINKSTNPLPKYQTEYSSGVDLHAFVESPVAVKKEEPVAIPTGIYIEISKGYEAQVRSRSGLALKGVFCLNAPGTIDSDYRGEIKVILANIKDEEFVIESGDRIAQLVFSKVEQVEFEETEELSQTNRASGGFGHTGV